MKRATVRRVAHCTWAVDLYAPDHPRKACRISARDLSMTYKHFPTHAEALAYTLTETSLNKKEQS